MFVAIILHISSDWVTARWTCKAKLFHTVRVVLHVHVNDKSLQLSKYCKKQEWVFNLQNSNLASQWEVHKLFHLVPGHACPQEEKQVGCMYMYINWSKNCIVSLHLAFTNNRLFEKCQFNGCSRIKPVGF